MAAVLCGGIGTLCKGCCDCLGQICMLPLKICGVCCQGLGQCCSESCKLVTTCCSSSFCCYITVACALNLPPILVGLLDIPNAVAGCAGSLWLLIFWLLSVLHIVAAFYMAHAIAKDDSILPSSRDEEHGTMAQFQQTAQNGAGRMTKLFCYDYWMAAYILVVLGYFVWLLLGGVWFATETMDDSSECADNIFGRVGIAYGFGWAFVFLGGCGLCCSLCCGLFMEPPGRRHPPPNNSTVTQSVKPATTDNMAHVQAQAIPENNDKPAYGSTTTSNPPAKNEYSSSSTNKPAIVPMEPPVVEVEAVPASKPSAPMATAVPY